MYTITKYGKPEWIGQKFNDLTVVRAEHTPPNWKWVCKCKCGNEKLYSPYKVITGHTKSCGCAKVERCHEMTRKYRIKHGGNGERLHRIWCGMKQRCNNPDSKDYVDWGRRGVKVCEEWQKDYSVFREWALSNGYREDLTIDRIDVNGNYEPNNCRWIALEQQNRNKRNSVYVEFNGERKLLIEFCEELGLNYYTVYGRINQHGWSVEEALSIPIGSCSKRNSLKEKCKQIGIPYSTVQYRRNKLGWDEERALNTPINKSKSNRRAK